MTTPTTTPDNCTICRTRPGVADGLVGKEHAVVCDICATRDLPTLVGRAYAQIHKGQFDIKEALEEVSRGFTSGAAEAFAEILAKQEREDKEWNDILFPDAPDADEAAERVRL